MEVDVKEVNDTYIYNNRSSYSFGLLDHHWAIWTLAQIGQLFGLWAILAQDWTIGLWTLAQYTND
jgi:hypothetical protein